MHRMMHDQDTKVAAIGGIVRVHEILERHELRVDDLAPSQSILPKVEDNTIGRDS
jgi:hypothetical protein